MSLTSGPNSSEAHPPTHSNNRTPNEDALHLIFGRHAMACMFQILLHANDFAGSEAACEALDEITQLEHVLSVYLDSSEVSRINRTAFYEDVRISDRVHRLLEMATQVHHETNGAFDITAAALSKAWGFFRRQGKRPAPEEIQAALQRCGTNWIETSEHPMRIRFLREGIEINPGGIGKGFALDEAASILQRKGIRNALLHGGKSSILAIGDQSPGESAWRIALRHPYDDQRILGDIFLKDQALGTSGAANQFFYFQGRRYGHVIDPRTGWPADGWLSVTAIARSAAEADAVATGMFVASEEELRHFASIRLDIGLIAVLPESRSGSTLLCLNLNEKTWQPAQSFQ